MTNNPMASDGISDRQLALWMLSRMQESAGFIDVLRKARAKGKRHALDQAQYRALHLSRVRKLHTGDDDEVVEVPPALAAKMEALIERDLLSGPEELLEKAIEAYVERTGQRALPLERAATFAMARDEIEGKTSGVFHKGFVADLAGSAREEMARDAEALRARESERGGRGE